MRGINLFDDLVDDLLRLRKNDGCTPNRIRESPAVIEILGGHQQLFGRLKARLISAIRALPSQRDTELLLAVMALTEEYSKIPLL